MFYTAIEERQRYSAGWQMIEYVYGRSLVVFKVARGSLIWQRDVYDEEEKRAIPRAFPIVLPFTWSSKYNVRTNTVI